MNLLLTFLPSPSLAFLSPYLNFMYCTCLLVITYAHPINLDGEAYQQMAVVGKYHPSPHKLKAHPNSFCMLITEKNTMKVDIFASTFMGISLIAWCI